MARRVLGTVRDFLVWFAVASNWHIFKYGILAQDSVLIQPKDCINLNQNEFNYFFDSTQLTCKPCGQPKAFQIASEDGQKCVCQPGYRITAMYGRILVCESCPRDQVTSIDGWGCVACDKRNISSDSSKCVDCSGRQISVERQLTGAYESPNKSVCSACSDNTQPSSNKQRCSLCSQFLGVQIKNSQCICPSENLLDGMCYLSPDDIKNLPNPEQLSRFTYVNVPVESSFFKINARTALAQCNKNYQNISACILLSNLCTLAMYDSYQNGVCDSYLKLIPPTAAQRPINNSWLYYTDQTLTILESTKLTSSYSFPDGSLNVILAAYHLNGSFLGFLKAKDGHLQLCKNTLNYLQAAYTFGTYFVQKCEVSVDELYDKEKHQPWLFDAYISYEDGGINKLLDIPVVITNLQKWSNDVSKKYDDVNSWKLVRRFFMVDNTAGKQDDSSHYVQYAKDLKIFVKLQKDTNDGRIYPPYIQITYGVVSSSDKGKTVPVTFSVSYSMDLTKQEKDIWIAFGVMSFIGVILSILTTWSWSNRSGQEAINCLTLIRMFFSLCAHLSNVTFLVVFVSSVWIMIFFKKQQNVTVIAHQGLNNEQFLGLLISAFVLKLLHVIHILFSQVNVDIFLIDWEKPSKIETVKTALSYNNNNNKVVINNRSLPTPSVWRMYLVANEWNEIQSHRKLNPVIQHIITIFFLEVVGLGNLASMDPKSELETHGDDKYYAPSSHLMRFAWIGIVYLVAGFVQLLFVVLLYERFLEDKIQQFVDLCSTCNISMFVFETDLFGYYIHGRSVHGNSDVGLQQMHENFIKEEKDVVCKRGLLPDDEQQTFQIMVPRKLRANINKITRPVLLAQNVRNQSGDKSESVQSIEAHYIINQLFMAFIDHSLTDIDYIVKKKTLMESLLNLESLQNPAVGTFYKDNGHSFDNVLFYGCEASLMIFEILLYACVDLIFSSYVLGGLFTLLFMKVFVSSIRNGSGKINLAKKTMVDRRFLI